MDSENCSGGSDVVVNFAFSEKGFKILLVNNFKFLRKHVSKAGLIRWCCEFNSKTKCPAKCYTQGETTELSNLDARHNHECDINKITRQVFSNSVKRKAVEDICERPEKLIRKEIYDDASGLTDNLTESDITRIRWCMWHARKQDQPPLPQNIGETHEALDSIPINTSKGECFLLENDRENNIVIFSCETNINVLRNSATILVDGTFDYCCKFFKQLFTILVVENGHYIPVLYCLLRDKKEQTYKLFFEKVQQLTEANPKKVIVDFEMAIHNAIKSVWTDVQIFGCRFHLTQSWFRKIQNLGLTSVYKGTSGNSAKEQKDWLHHVFGLPYLSPEEVGPSFVEDFMSSMPDNPKLRKFADYLVETYVDNGSLFPPALWASFTDEPVTNNPCESFHAHFKKNFYCAHPDVFSFAKQLLNTQTSTYVKIRSVAEPPRKNDKRFKVSQGIVREAREKYLSREISRFDFVKKVSGRYSHQKK